MSKNIAIHWFRSDLRLTDNPALLAAAGHEKVLPIYIFDDRCAGEYAMGAASRWWLHHSLHALRESLHGNLSIYCGDPIDVIGDLLQRYPTAAIYWNRCYEPWRIAKEGDVKEFVESRNVAAKSFNGSLLWEPWSIVKSDGGHYKVFTPFYRKGCLSAETPREPLPPVHGRAFLCDEEGSLSIDELKLLPKIRWDHQLEPHWEIGEIAARKRLEQFIEEGLPHYREGRDLPAKSYVSRLSPHLHFGELSPNQCWHGVVGRGKNVHVDHFCSELGWREFSYHQLYHYPDLPKKNLQEKFNRFPWREDKKVLAAWQKGETGIPMVDAGMRELWQTGYMHNRVRMIVGSFLVKNLLLHWHHGERWFWDCLVDADLANNSASWQWVAGCGADAAPYFRIFNPVTQGEKFDPDGVYIRRYLPEIAALPNRYLFSPWMAPKTELQRAGIELGVTYPRPIVDLKASRSEALQAFQSLKG